MFVLARKWQIRALFVFLILQVFGFKKGMVWCFYGVWMHAVFVRLYVCV